MDHRRALQAADHRAHQDTSPIPARRDVAEPRVAPVHISFLIDRSLLNRLRRAGRVVSRRQYLVFARHRTA